VASLAGGDAAEEACAIVEINLADAAVAVGGDGGEDERGTGIDDAVVGRTGQADGRGAVNDHADTARVHRCPIVIGSHRTQDIRAALKAGPVVCVVVPTVTILPGVDGEGEVGGCGGGGAVSDGCAAGEGALGSTLQCE